MDPLHELQATLMGWVRWYRLRRAVLWAVRGLLAGLALFILVVWITFLNSLLPREAFLRLLPLLALGGVVMGALVAYIWPLPRLEAARRFDRLFGLRERVSTALELAGRASDEPDAEFSVLRQRQLEDAIAHARLVKASRSLPLRFNKTEIFLVIVLFVAAAATWWRAEPYFIAAHQAQLLQQSITQERGKIEAMRQQIVQDPNLTLEQRAALTTPLDQTLRELQKAQTPEQAVAALESAAGKLQALSDPQVAQQAQALQEAGQNLSQQAATPLQSFGQDLANGDILDAAHQLQNLEPQKLTPEEQQALAGQLESSANSLAQSNPQLAQQLQQAAGALHNGNTQAAQQAMQNAAQTLAQAGAQISQSQQANQAVAQLGQAQRSIAQAKNAGQADGQTSEGSSASGNPASGNTASGQNQVPGAGQQAGSASGQGQGQAGTGGTTVQNNGAGGGGAGRGQGSGDTGPGPEAGTTPIDQGNGPGDGGESPYEPIYAPQHLGGEGGPDVALPGSDKPGEQIIGQGNSQPQQPGQSQVPYINVYPSYADAYRQAIESGQVPPQLRNLVKQYFSSLAP